ncbi:nucleolar complex protein 14, partial [Teratosphaeriaceae sp. CCFEE 6253]
MRRRGKVGGVVDRRIGEGEGGMTAEERGVVRFAREREGRGGARAGAFDLEGSEDEGFGGLTHGGRAIGELVDDDMGGGSDGSEDEGLLVRKRSRSSDDDEDEVGEGVDGQGREVKKSKKEVMQELIAKSKHH